MPALLVSHRGGAALAPENSRAALTRALAAGAAAVEIDARATADDLLVVLHDPSPKRMTGDPRRCAGTPARDLLEQRLIGWPAEALLLLDEALEILAGRTLIDIELKPDPEVSHERLGRLALEALERAGSPKDVIVTSRSVELLAWLAGQAPLLRRGLVFGSTETRDAREAARQAGAGLVVANGARVDRRLAGALEADGVELWAYTINDAEQARRLIELGVTGLVTDDEVTLGRELGVRIRSGGGAELPAARQSPDRLGPGARASLGEEAPAGRDVAVGQEPEGPRLLALDLGSTRLKAALVDPAAGVTDLVSRPTPTSRPAPGRVVHDPVAVLAAVRELIEQLAGRTGSPPVGAGLASQRSTALWTSADGGEPLTPALSWRDTRGEELVAALGSRKTALEREAGLPLLAAWSAVKGAWLRSEMAVPDGARLTPLGGWIAGRLCGGVPIVDPGLANRMFLLRRDGAGWSPALLDAFGLTEDRLPRLVPTVGCAVKLSWPGGGDVPLLALAGDQQAAYVGAVGPLGRGVVLNLGTAGFLMRSATSGERADDPRLRRAPLWTSLRQPRPRRFLLEVPLLGRAVRALAAGSPARQIALGESGPLDLAGACRDAGELLGRSGGMLRLAGGGSRSPQLRRFLARELNRPLELAEDSEATLLGAARLAAAGAGIVWSPDHRDGPRDGILRQAVD